MLRHDIVSVVGGGWSVSQIDLETIPGTIIAVNDSAMRLPRWDYAVSMDRLWTEYRFASLRLYARNTWLRRNAVQNVEHKGKPWLQVFECDNTSVQFSHAPDRLNGTNSGGCALNLAHQCRPKELYLFGFDMCRGPNGEPYWHDPYPWAPNGATKPGKFREWAPQFELIARQFAEIGTIVRNVTTRSLIDSFAKVHPRSLGMVREDA